MFWDNKKPEVEKKKPIIGQYATYDHDNIYSDGYVTKVCDECFFIRSYAGVETKVGFNDKDVVCHYLDGKPVMADKSIIEVCDKRYAIALEKGSISKEIELLELKNKFDAVSNNKDNV